MHPKTAVRWLIAVMIATLAFKIAISFLPVEFLLTKTIDEDAFYYFMLSQNIASGNGATFDRVNPTNGFQPLWTWMLVPLYWIFPAFSLQAVTLSLVVLMIFSVATSYFVFRIVEKYTNSSAGLVAGLFWLLNPFVFFIGLNGMETAMAGWFFGLLIFVYVNLRKGVFEMKDYFLIGITAALAIYSRFDAVLLFIVILFDMMVAQTGNIAEKFKPAFFTGIIVTLLILPWFVWNYVNFDTIRQVSSVAIPFQHHQWFLEEYGSYLSGAFVWREVSYASIAAGIAFMISGFGGLLPFGMVRYSYYFSSLSSILVWGGIGLIILLFIIKTGWKFKGFYAKIKSLNFLLVFSLLIFLYYPLYHWYLPMRYFYPLLIVISIYFGLLFYYLSWVALKKYHYRTIALGFLGVLVLLSFVQSGREFWSFGRSPWHKEFLDDASWIKANTPPDAVIGAFNAGILGYFSGRRVVNLDGVINNNAFEAMKGERLGEFMLEQNISYLSDHQHSVDIFSTFYGKEWGKEHLRLERQIPGTFHGDNPRVIYRVLQNATLKY